MNASYADSLKARLAQIEIELLQLNPNTVTYVFKKNALVWERSSLRAELRAI